MRFINRKTLALAGAAAALVAVSSVGTATAGSLINSSDIQDDTVRSADLKDGAVRTHDLSKRVKAGTLDGAIYRVANYTNGGAGDATVACADDAEVSQQYTAIAGGVQAGGVQSMGQPSEFDVAASFPGRMDWDTGQPKADRLDGWIVLGSGGWSETLKVWTLCVPTTSIPVQVTDIDN